MCWPEPMVMGKYLLAAAVGATVVSRLVVFATVQLRVDSSRGRVLVAGAG